jgi:Ca-activated chloride channel family protein
MPGTHAMEVPASRRGASLVSVDGRAYPLQSARIQAEASGGIAFSTLVQTYRNPYAEPLEVVYTLPLPADGAVVEYSIRLGERVIRGEVRSREEARASYEKALFEGKTAGLLEQERDDTFTQRLGSLPAGVSAEITIEVLHPTAFLLAAGEDGPQWEYRFPTVASVRYEGAPGRVPDADKLDVDRAGTPGEIPTRIELTLTTTDEAGAAVRRVEAMPLDRDLVVRWAAAGREIGARLVEGPGLPGDDGRYGLLTITPPRAPEAEFARDLTILIDASGSMSGPPIEWAKDVASGLLRGLGSGDRFEVIAFASRPKSLTGGIVPVTERTLGAALGDLATLRAGGGTEMADAMVEALRPLRPGSQHQVVLISDGQIGFEDEIVARIVKGLPDGARLHTVGVGAAPNRTLTSRAARAGRGVESFICGDEEVAGTVRRLAAATARPVLTDLRIASNVVNGIAPARPRDVLAGQPVVVALELAREGGSIEVSGRLAGHEGRWTWRVDVPPLAARAAVTTVPLGALYGRELIADGETAASSADRLLAAALRHRIASRMTSLVAISDEPSVDPKAPRRSQVLAVEVPAFLSAEGLGLQAGLTGGFRTRGVMEAVSYARALRAGEQSEQSMARLLGSRLTPSRGRHVLARVLAVQGELLVLEFESPEGGFLVPDGEVAASIFGRPIGPVSIDPAQSSPRGPHAQGLLLRLAVRRTAGWPVGGAYTLEWGNGVTLEFTLGDRA